jgi:hypothetical protein
MASGRVNRIQRPNTWLLRPMLHTRRKLLPTRSRPHMARRRRGTRSAAAPLLGWKQTLLEPPENDATDP